MAVDRFLLQLEDPQLAFSVRQKRPSNMDEAVTYTLGKTRRASLQSSHNAAEIPRNPVETQIDVSCSDATGPAEKSAT